MKRFTKLISLAALLVFCLTALPLSASAAEAKTFRAVWVLSLIHISTCSPILLKSLPGNSSVYQSTETTTTP